MNFLTDVLKFDDKFEKIKISGGQTQGFVKAPDELATNYLTERKRGCGGTEYAHIIRQKEEEKEKRKMSLYGEGTSTTDPMHNVDDLTSLGTIPNVDELDREELTQVYENYDFESKKTGESVKLAVFDHKEKILSMIRSYRVCVIKGNTGCGKTTQIPQMILDSYFEAKRHCNIIVTQPRRIAAISVAKRVSDERSWALGTIVGYQVGLEKRSSTDTRLLYCTTGVLLQKLIMTKNMNEYTHVILDEVHERDQDMDFLMLVVRKFQRTVSPHVKIILMSATINTNSFTQYFSSSVGNASFEAPVLEVGQKTNFPVSIYYLDGLEAKLGTFPEISEQTPRIGEKSYEYVVKIIEAFDVIDETEAKVDSQKKGSVLVFLPGLHEIEMLYEALETTQMNFTKRMWWICPLHSTITADEQMKAFRVPPAGHRKIILSTNIAESSITVPDIKYVIDFCLTKIMYADPDTNLSSLHISWASKSQCEQRSGRVGRVMAGRVYRLVPKHFYDYCMQDETEPEIIRCPLETVVLKSKLLEMGEPMEILALAMDPPDLNRLEQTILVLKEVGALLMTVNGDYNSFDGDLTWLGRIMAGLPLDIRISKLIVLGHIFSILEETIIMGCAMTVKSMFSKPFKQDLQAYISRLTWADSTCSDSIACLNAYQLWRFCKTSGKFDISTGGGAKSWGKRFFIQLNAMHEVARLQDEVTHRLKNQFGIEESKGPNRVKWDKVTKPLITKIVLAGAFYPNYFVRSQSGGQIDESTAVKILGGRDPFSTVYLTNFPTNQPGPLYGNAIREHFSDCGVPPSNIKVAFDCSSKVYIEFKGDERKQPRENDDRNLTSFIPGKISMAVYRALKMRHYTSSSVNILVLPPDEARKQIEKLEQAKQVKKQQVDKITILPSVSTIFIEIRISHVNDPGNFFAQYTDKDHHLKLVKIHRYLNSIAKLRNLNRDEVPRVNKMYAAPFRDPEGTNEYYRAKVIDFKNRVAKILFVDYGNTENVGVQALCKFDPIQKIRVGSEVEEFDVENEPHLAINCTLALIQPSLTKNHRALWSNEANMEFSKKCCGNSNLIAKVYSVVNDSVALEIYISDLTGHLKMRKYEEDARTMLTINKYLVDKKLAEWNEESYLSKLNHEIRASHQNENTDLNYDTIDSKAIASLSGSLWEDVEVPSLPKQNYRRPVRLKGPDSPLEMTIYSCTQSNQKKQAFVEQDSVNSVLLDTHPHDPHERMLVAATLGQSPNGERLTLRYTTMLPNIHGLSAFICLLFCPTAEFRVNKACTRLTGALCGLGYNPDNEEPYFPENDMEVNFDTSFSIGDILAINKLRYWMSVFMSVDEDSQHDPANFTSRDTIEHQKKVEKLILQLLEQLGQQRTERVESHCQPFRWGQIDSNRLLDPGLSSSWAVYRLHFGVSLEDEPVDFEPDERLKRNINQLKEIALGHASVKGAMCDLCQVSFDNNVRSLKLHLQSTQHCELATRFKLI